MPTTETYTQPDGSSTEVYYMDIEVNPATLKSGELVKRFDGIVYPRVGTTHAPKQGTAGSAPSAPIPANGA